jgi:hypothetical protein
MDSAYFVLRGARSRHSAAQPAAIPKTEN